MGRKRIYSEAPTVTFHVRVHEKHEATVKKLAKRFSVSEVEAKRMILDAGASALGAVA